MVEEETLGTRTRRLVLRHPARPRELGAIRRRVGQWARAHALPPDALADLQLALGEAVSNGVEHAYLHTDGGAERATVDVELEMRAPGVAVLVVDHGRWRPVPADKGYRGHGLGLIERLSRNLRVLRTSRGTRVSFDIPLG